MSSLSVTAGVLVGGIVGLVGGSKLIKSFNESAVKRLTPYEQNIKELKNTLTADKFELIGSCLENNEVAGFPRMLSLNNIADSLKKGVSFDSIAKEICKQGMH